MLAIKGFYNGKEILPLEDLPKKKKYKIIITFLEEIDDDIDIRDFTSSADSFTFWNNQKEDIYQDYLNKEN